MHSKLKRGLAGLVAAAAGGVVVPLVAAAPALAAPTLSGTAMVKTANGAADLASGDANDPWTLRLPSLAACASDGTQGGRAATYMMPGSQNPATDLELTGGGALVGSSLGSGGTGTFKNNLFNTSGTPIRSLGLNLGDAVIINIPNFDYAVFTSGQIPSGVYNIGIACYDLDEPNASATFDPNNFWNQRITVTYPGGDAAGAEISWAVGEPPVKPVIGTVTAADQSLTVPFTQTPASNPVSTFTGSATPDGTDADCATATAATAGPASGSPLSFTGLVNACTYAVTVTASNGLAPSATSDPVNATPSPSVRPGVTGLASVAGVEKATLSWTPPAPETPARTGYDVAWTATGQTGGSATLAPDVTSFVVAPLVPGVTYTCTVTPAYPSPYTAAAVSIACLGNSAQSIEQHIEVNRPVGALVLTQQCGRYGSLGAEEATADFPAFGVQTATGTGTAPFETWSDATFTGSDPAGDFGEYPYPVDEDGADDDLATQDDNDTANPTYPTSCGVDLGVAKLVKSGPNAGKYFQSSGRLNQVTVVDTRDTDDGWTLNGAIVEFRKRDAATGAALPGDGNAFTGKALGWTPELSFRTAPIDTDFDGIDDYFPDADEASPAYPGTTGLGPSGKALGSATQTHGLGVASFDARLKVLIPVTKVNGRYTGRLTFTFV